MEIVALLLNAHGDYLLNLPALRGLKHIYGNALKIVVRKGVYDAFLSDFNKASIFEIDLPSRGWRFIDPFKLHNAIGSPATLISLNPWHAPSIEALLNTLSTTVTIGFFDAFDRHVKLDFSKHSFDLAFDIVSELDKNLLIDTFASLEELRMAARLNQNSLQPGAVQTPWQHLLEKSVEK